MTILYDILDNKVLSGLSVENKKIFISEVILTGNFEYFKKFSVGLNMTEVFNSDEILKLLPMNIDTDLLNYFLETFEFNQGMNFFYNYALFNDNNSIREVIYEYFVENYSDIIFEKMNMYSKLVE